MFDALNIYKTLHSIIKEHALYSNISWTFKIKHVIPQSKSQLIAKKSVSDRTFSVEITPLH